MERPVHRHNAGRWLRVEPSWHRKHGPIHYPFGRSRWPSSCNCTHQCDVQHRCIHDGRCDDYASDHSNGCGDHRRGSDEHRCSGDDCRRCNNTRRDGWRRHACDGRGPGERCSSGERHARDDG